MAKTLCYGHNDISSSLMRVATYIWFCSYSSKVEQNTVNICIDVRVILRTNFKLIGGYSLKVELLYVA
jgi:hypothetical protein